MATIVFCEDEASIRKLILTSLRASNHEILMAENGAEGLALIEESRPDVVFTDIAMPVMDGYELWSRIQAHPELRQTPVAVITASVQRDQVEHLKTLGLVHYLAKPFTMSGLREKVREMVEIAALHSTSATQ
jgi:two-component system, sensor histidine kinase